MVYLDHAASTTLRPAAGQAWLDAAMRVGNPSSTHSSGRWGRKAVEDSRESIAEHLGIPPDSIIFVSGGTEADNMGITGVAQARRAEDPRRDVVITSPVEHKAVLDPAEALAANGMTHELVRVDSQGLVDIDHLRQLLTQYRGRVAVVGIMWANNETGVIQDIPGIAKLCRQAKVPLHSDAVQAVGADNLDLNLPNSSALSAHKLGGPKGVGIFIHHNRYPVDPVIRGGGQELKLRAGTLNVPGIVGMATAFDETFADLAASNQKYRRLRDRLVQEVTAQIDDVEVNNDPDHSLPGVAHLGFRGCEADSLMLLLDAVGVQVSVGSACSAGVAKTSHVLEAMELDPLTARGSLRISVGWDSTDEDIDKAIAVLPEAVNRARRAGLSVALDER